MLYGVIGARVYWDRIALVLTSGAKSNDLNEEAEQAGAEGKERLRAILILSALLWGKR